MRRRVLYALVMAATLVVSVAAKTIFDAVTVDNTAGGVPLTAAKISPPGGPQMQRGACRLEGAEIRFTYDGDTAPTTTVGTLAEIGDTIPFNTHEQLFLFRAIRTGASSGTLSCNYTP